MKKLPKPNIIPESIIKKVKEKTIRKLKSEIELGKKKHLYIIPLYKRNNILNAQSITNESKKFSNNTFCIQNFNFQNNSKKKSKEWKKFNGSTERNINLQNRNLKGNTIKLKNYFLSKNTNIYETIPTKKTINSLDKKYYNKYLKTINNEMSISRLLNGIDNFNLKKNEC